jgi:hypothetical protein
MENSNTRSVLKRPENYALPFGLLNFWILSTVSYSEITLCFGKRIWRCSAVKCGEHLIRSVKWPVTRQFFLYNIFFFIFCNLYKYIQQISVRVG